jgi:sugar lactone lactonase YvrE
VRRILIVAVLVSVACAALAAAPAASDDPFASAEAVFTAALEAQKAGDASDYRSGLERAAERLPDPTRLLYRLAAARLADGDRAGALAALGRMIDAGFARDPRGDEAFAPVADDPVFTALMAKLDGLAEPRVASEIVATIPERAALFEGIARHPFSGSLFLSSVHQRKVIRVSPDGEGTDFVKPSAHGLAAALGLAVDERRKLLWIVSAGLPQAKGLTDAERDRSALLAVDFDTGELRRRIEAPPGKRWWNDLAIARDGAVYVSDPGSASIARVAVDGAVTTVVEGRGLRSPGGLALATDERVLYVADWTNGLAAVDLASGELAWLAPPSGATTLGIDGLRRHGDDLIAIQNGVPPHRITRFTLAPGGRSLASAELLERDVPGWDEPTLGVLAGDALLYVANSQWPKFGDDGATPDPSNLVPTVVRQLALR